MKAPFLVRLKGETLSDHLAVEAMLTLDNLTASVEAYHAKLRLLYAFHAPAERVLAAGAGRIDGALAMDERHKVHLLADDLRATAPPFPEPPVETQSAELEALSAPLDLLGLLYVVEGSTLGGAVIARHVAARLGLGPANGCAFFAAYGAEVGSRWRTVCSVLLRHADTPQSEARIIDAARRTFAAFRARLSAAAPSAA